MDEHDERLAQRFEENRTHHRVGEGLRRHEWASKGHHAHRSCTMSARGEAVRHEKSASTRLFLVVVASGVFVTVITATMINVLIPLMRAEFGASSEGTERPLYEVDLNDVRESLGRERFTEAWKRGQAMTLEQAVAYALEDGETSPA